VKSSPNGQEGKGNYDLLRPQRAYLLSRIMAWCFVVRKANLQEKNATNTGICVGMLLSHAVDLNIKWKL